MQTIHKLYCVKCKETDKPLIKNSIRKSKDKLTQYYYCRDCNSERYRRYYRENTEKARQYIYKSILKHHHKQTARLTLNYQIRIGNVTRPDICCLCGQGGRIQGHHTDYTKPLEVVWLCSDCHADADRLNK